MIKINLVSLFRKVNEGGEYIPSIIAYASYPWEMTDRMVTKTTHRLYINLWIIELRFRWETK